jgi:transitional endoplasmic reticulum ATPase
MGSDIGVAEPQLRNLDDTRLEAAVRLWEESGDTDRPAAFSLAEVLAAVTSHDPGLVAIVGDDVIGAIAAAVDGNRAWIVRWSVAPTWRRRGVGAALLAGLERRLASLGIHEVSLLAARGTEAVEAAGASGYATHDDLLYLSKRRLQRGSADERVEELGGQWLSPLLWDDIGGMEREKDLIERRIVLPLARREEAARHGVAAASAVILFGPPGTGKTTFAKAVAGRLSWPFIEIFPSQLTGSDAHGRAGALRDLFDQLLYLDSVVVFIDEVEEIASHRQERPDTHVMANELLKVIPQFRDGDSRLLVVATNAVHELDHAFTRPGRFDYVLPIGPPDLEARTGIWRRYVSQITEREIDVRLLAERSPYFSAADIEFAARKAAQAAFERSLVLGHAPAEEDDFLTAIGAVRPSITAATAREFEDDIVRYARY